MLLLGFLILLSLLVLYHLKNEESIEGFADNITNKSIKIYNKANKEGHKISLFFKTLRFNYLIKFSTILSKIVKWAISTTL